MEAQEASKSKGNANINMDFLISEVYSWHKVTKLYIFANL